MCRGQNELIGNFKMAAGYVISIWGQVMEYTYIPVQCWSVCVIHNLNSSPIPMVSHVGTVCTVWSRSFTLFWLRKSSVIVKTFQLSFHVFVYAFIQRSLHLFGKSFRFLFLFLAISKWWWCRHIHGNSSHTLYECQSIMMKVKIIQLNNSKQQIDLHYTWLDILKVYTVKLTWPYLLPFSMN